MATPDVPVVPRRNDPKPGFSVYGESKALQMAGQNPDFHYEFFSQDPKHPSYVGNRTRKHEIGSPATGYLTVEPWEVVENKDAIQGRKRADDGKGVDTTVTNGSLIYCRIPKAEHAKYGFINDRKVEVVSEGMSSGERGGTSYAHTKVKVHQGWAEDGAAEMNPHELLNGAR